MSRSVVISGQRYRIGLYGWVFVQRGQQWCKTNNVTKAEVRRALKADDQR